MQTAGQGNVVSHQPARDPTFDPIRLPANNPGPMTGSGNHTYLLVGERGAALIDAGIGDDRHVDAIAAATAGRGVTLTDVLVTHAHADHASGAPALLARFPSARFHKVLWTEEDVRVRVDWQPLFDGERVLSGDHTLVVAHTAGHSPDHAVFWHETTRTVFSGDLVIQDGSVMIHASKGGSLARYMQALERLIALRPAVMLPSHGPDIADPTGLLQQYLDHRRLRERQVLEALASGRRTVLAIAESIYHGLDPALLPAALENVRAHLDKLKAEGRAVERDAGWSL